MAGASRESVAAALEARPELRVSDSEFTAYLRDVVVPRCPDPCLDEALVTYTCLLGQSAGLSAFDRDYLRPAAAAVASMGLASDEIDDLLQTLRERLFVAADGARPRIEAYAGGGRLVSLLRVSLARLGVDRLRARGKKARDLDALLAAGITESPGADKQLIDQRQREHFAQALRAAMEGLTPRQRSLLRLHVLDGVTLAQLARSYQVHRATIVRWLAQARAEILERTRVAMAQRLRLPEGELEALHLTVSSQLDLSLKRLLASHLSER